MDYNQWVQLAESSQLAHNDQRSPSTLDDWVKDRPTNPSLDININEFTTLGDLGGKLLSFKLFIQLWALIPSMDLSDIQAAAAAVPSSPQSFYAPFQHSNFFATTPYPTMAYGSTWSSQNHLPLSNYSSLNGATTSSSSTQSSSQQQQPQQLPQPSKQPSQQHPSTTQPMMIEYV